MIRTGNPSVYVSGVLRAVTARRADGPLGFALFRQGRLRGSAIDPSAVASLASAIQTQEGYYPGSLAYQNNTPGNLVYAGQAGATQGAGGGVRPFRATARAWRRWRRKSTWMLRGAPMSMAIP